MASFSRNDLMPRFNRMSGIAFRQMVSSVATAECQSEYEASAGV